jgi:hypothetical protein
VYQQAGASQNALATVFQEKAPMTAPTRMAHYVTVSCGPINSKKVYCGSIQRLKCNVVQRFCDGAI